MGSFWFSKARVFLLFFFLILINADDEKCWIENIDFGSHNIFGYSNDFVVKDNENTTVETLKYSKVEAIRFKDNKYLEVQLKYNQIEISTNDNFVKNYENKEVGNKIKDTLVIKCPDEKPHEIEYIQHVEDINNHPPKFNKEEYNFIYYGQLPRGFELTSIIDIWAIDQDCTDENLQFTIDEIDASEDNRDLLYLYKNFANDGRKENIVLLQTTKQISWPVSVKYHLTADDRRGRKHIVELRFNIKPSQEELSFENKEYKGNTELARESEIEFESKVALKNGFDSFSKVEIVKSTYSEYFHAQIDLPTNSIKVTVRKDLPEVPQLRSGVLEISLHLKAKSNGDEAETQLIISSQKAVALICKVPGINLDSDSFNNPDYIADTTRAVIFRVEDTLNVADITCESDYLMCTFNPEINTFMIETTEYFINSYEKNEDEQRFFTNLTIKCPYEEKTIRFFQYIEDSNNYAPEFLKNEYTFVFFNQIPKQFAITDLQDILVKDIDIGNVYCGAKIDDKATENFYVESSSFKSKMCNMKLISKKAISGPFDQTVILTAFDDGEPTRSTNTEVRIKVTHKSDALKFTQDQYTFFFNMDTKSLTLREEEPLQIKNGFDRETIFELTENKYSNLFTINGDIITGKIEIKPIYDQFMAHIGELNKNDVVSLQVKALWKGYEAITSVSIFENLEKPSSTTTTTTTTTEKPKPNEPGQESTEKPTTKEPNTEQPTTENPNAEQSTTENPKTVPPIETTVEEATDGNRDEVLEVDGHLKSFLITSTVGISLAVVASSVTLSILVCVVYKYFLQGATPRFY